MENLEILKRAKLYMDKLANGIDPITETEMSEDTILNNVRLSRCFFYVSDILRQVIDNGGVVAYRNKTDKNAFYMSDEQIKSFEYVTNCYMKDLIDKINITIQANNCKKLQFKSLTSWLIEKDLLEEYTDNDGRNYKRATAAGDAIGLKTERRTGIRGEYNVTLLNASAQTYIINNINSIVQAPNPNIKTADFQGRPWSREHDEMLIDLYNKAVSVYEIAVTLKRTQTGIRARLKKLGIID